ncbi:MAG: hypothetical protein BMS9Abin12_2170 [Acidimicrobiia bacterium]|nr:MAG: hypothetical protein BMS9Abin12_2170 [Acidimicrobiia bacterium]
MLRFGAAWYGFREQTPTNYFEMVAGLGLRYVEVPLLWQIVDGQLFNFRLNARIDEVSDAATRAGVQIVSSVSHFDLAGDYAMLGEEVDESRRRFGLAAARRAIDIGARLGLEVMRITEPGIRPDRLEEAESTMEALGKVLSELGDYADQYGIKIAVENYELTSQQVLWALEAADHSAVGTLYDPCNYFRIGEDPLDALRKLRGWVVYGHLKDQIRNDERDPNLLFPGSRWAPSVAVGDGDIVWEPILAELADSYDGYLCYEYEMPADVMVGTRRSHNHVLAIATDIGIQTDPKPVRP